MTELTLDDLIWEDGSVQLADTAFPVRVQEDNGQSWDEVRVALAVVPNSGDYALCVWHSGSGLGPVLLSLRVIQSIEIMHPSQRAMTVEDGTRVFYTPSGGCACGSQLKSYLPWGRRRVIAAMKPAVPWVRGA